MPLPPSLQRNPRLGHWLRFSADGQVEVRSGKVEIGQGILTSLAQIVAQQLEVPLGCVRMLAANTALSPNEAVTSGSLSIQESGAALWQVCAEVRHLFLQAVALQWGVSSTTLRIEAGEVQGPDGRHSSYWAWAQQADVLAREAEGLALPASAATGAPVLGQSLPRSDLPDKIFGVARYIQDLDLPGLLHGRVLRPPSPGATLLAVDTAPASQAAGVLTVLRDGQLLGVVAGSVAQADAALVLLARSARWREVAHLPDVNALVPWLKQQPLESHTVDHKQRSDKAGPGAVIARTLKASFSKPYIAHAAMAPSCALARWDDQQLAVWSHSQGIFNLRRDLGLALGRPEESIVVQHVEGAGCYGHNGADDVAFDAAWLARAVPGRPVRVQWSRSDELSWSPLGPAMAMELEADLDATGHILDWRHSIWGNGHSTRPGRAPTPALLGAAYLRTPFAAPLAINMPLASGGGAERNAIPGYDLEAWEITSHRVMTMPLRTSALRSLGALGNVFASESFMDEIAHASGQDPIAFRLRYLNDARARAVIERVLTLSAWRDWQPREGAGHGIGFARYKNTGAWCAVVAEIDAGQEIRVTRLWIAADVGRVINPDGVINQIEGGAVQAVSWTLKEAVQFDATRITSDAWERYPILRFSEVPAVQVALIDSQHASLGAGEASLGPTAAAVGNAVFHALGVRVRDLPITAERIVAAMD
jgi:nicotinate dehydrogenase subunit B